MIKLKTVLRPKIELLNVEVELDEKRSLLIRDF